MRLNTEKIKQEMERLGLNQSQLARKMGISKQAVNYYFKAKPIKAAEKFGDFFLIPPKDLIV